MDTKCSGDNESTTELKSKELKLDVTNKTEIDGLNTAEVEGVQKVFNKFDKNKSGFLEEEEFREFTRYITRSL